MKTCNSDETYYSNFGEETDELVQYLSRTKPKHYEDSLRILEQLNRCLISKPYLPRQIDEQIIKCCIESRKEHCKERFEIYGYENTMVDILSVEDLIENGVIHSRSQIRVSFDEKNFLEFLKNMKGENMKTTWHHTHPDLSWPHSRDLSIMKDSSEYLDLGIISRFKFGTVYVDVKSLDKLGYEFISDYKSAMSFPFGTLGLHQANFYFEKFGPKKLSNLIVPS